MLPTPQSLGWLASQRLAASLMPFHFRVAWIPQRTAMSVSEQEQQSCGRIRMPTHAFCWRAISPSFTVCETGGSKCQTWLADRPTARPTGALRSGKPPHVPRTHSHDPAHHPAKATRARPSFTVKRRSANPPPLALRSGSKTHSGLHKPLQDLRQCC